MKEINFYIKTIGCKLNFTESSHISSYLTENSLTGSDDKSRAEVFILNTCSVTGQAEKKCIQEIRAFNRINPAATVIVTGCFANLNSSQIAKEQNVKIVQGTDIRRKREEILNTILQPTARASSGLADEGYGKFIPVWSSTRTRCFLKIQDGCDNQCAYCAVHLARGKSRSASIAEVCRAVAKASESGVREIVITGLNTADFGRLNGETFLDLLRAIDLLPETPRMRISSVEPNLLSRETVLFIKESQHFMPHFHIPLQSGSDRVLSMMRRRYSTLEFERTIDFIKTEMPDSFIGTDLIGGMNGETEADFEASYNFVERLPLSFIHVFPYSERPDTQAIDFMPVVSQPERRSRVSRLLTLSNKRLTEFYIANAQKTFDVLFETKSKDHTYHGFTNNYIKTEINSTSDLRNRIVRVKLTELNTETMRMKGEML